MKYFKINPIVEAIQWTNEPGNFSRLIEWCGPGNFSSASPLLWDKSGYRTKSSDAEVKTPEGATIVPLGHYIIKHREGCFYPVTKSCFERLYMPLPDTFTT